MSARLSDKHLKMLREDSGISDEVIKARGYRTVTDEKELTPLGFSVVQRRTPGLLMPGYGPDGSNGFCTFRPDSARVVVNKREREPDGNFKQRVIKYEMPSGSGLRLDSPPICREQLKDPSIPLWITEGTKKADAGASRGLCIISLNGVNGFKGKNEYGGVTFLADWDYIALKGRDVRIVFDSDVMHKPEVRKALDRLTAHLQRKGAHVSAVYLPGGRDSKTGVDDYLLTHTVEELEALVDAPRPQTQPAPPVVEMLDTPPLTLRRPLSLAEGRAYAATWIHTKTTVTESLDRDGNIIKHNPPIETTSQRLFIVRDDGTIFGEGGDAPMDDLGLDVRLLEIPATEKLWSARSVKAFRQGQRPDIPTTFNRVVDCVDRFIDFNRSLADQRTMGEMVACYVMGTWFLDAFNVAGNLWPNGEKGSGKTQLLITVAKLSYLGQVILASASFAALRDMANYGAFLAFDDAENLSDPKRTDPDKRTLLLAGNRRGNTVAIKVMGPDKNWITEHVDTYSPRAFSAIRLPDATLASRTIVVPLIRTPDRYRANADPSDDAAWPHDRRKLVDELWALALANLNKLPPYEARINQEATLTGRNLEPWRALLSVALWLDENGVPGLWHRMEKLSRDYQTERQDMESGDLTVLVIRALCRRAGCDVSDLNDVSDVNTEGGRWNMQTSQITESAKRIAEEQELDIDIESITSRRIGRAMGKMRFKQKREAGKGTKGWTVTAEELQGWVVSQGLFVTKQSNQPDPSHTNVTNVTKVTNVTGKDASKEENAPAEEPEYEEVF